MLLITGDASVISKIEGTRLDFVGGDVRSRLSRLVGKARSRGTSNLTNLDIDNFLR